MHTLFLKKHLPLILVVGLLILINILAIVWYFIPEGPDQWHADVVPGKVASISTSTLVTIDPRGTTKKFIITENTVFFAGKNTVTSDEVPVGAFVLVQLDTSTTTPAVVRDIRIMTDKRKNKKVQ